MHKEDHTDEIIELDNGRKKHIRFCSRDELYGAYVGILSDLEGSGAYEPVAHGIRHQWAALGLGKKVLNQVDKRFKNIKREEVVLWPQRQKNLIGP